MTKFLLFTFAAFFVSVPSFAQSAAAPPVVMELFTSQGCAYCPPADALLDAASKQPGIIALSCHVDYFRVRNNALGKSICTQRQRNYMTQLGKRSRFTPQLVVNGTKDMIGYEADKVSAALMKGRMQNIAPVTITRIAAGGRFEVSLPQIVIQSGTVQLLLVTYDAPHTMAITEGNNLGKMITYTNVVNRIEDMGVWDGAAKTLNADPHLTLGEAGFAVLAQDTVTGKIVAAGQARR